MLTIGLTGNFGMGKTTVLHLFEKSGVYTFNSDEYVHKVLKDPGMANKIAALLGEDVLKKAAPAPSLDRKAVAGIIFRDSRKRKMIEELIHPGVLKEIKKTIARTSRKDPSAIIVFEVPLLFEAGYEHSFDHTVFIYCARMTAVRRLSEKGYSKDEVLRRMRAQMPVTHKKKLADFIIDNNNGIEKTGKQVRRLLEKWRR